MLQFNFNWDKLSVSAGLTLRNVYFRLYPGAIGELEVIDFLKALVHHLEPPQRLPERLRGAERARPQSAAPHAPQTAFNHSLLETVLSLLRLTLYYTSLK